jgi:hypothetical protein
MLQEDFTQDGSNFLFGDVDELNVPEFACLENLILAASASHFFKPLPLVELPHISLLPRSHCVTDHKMRYGSNKDQSQASHESSTQTGLPIPRGSLDGIGHCGPNSNAERDATACNGCEDCEYALNFG